MTLRSIALFVVAALFEIGGAWLVWQAVREGRGWWFAPLGVLALGLYGFAASFQPDAQFVRILAAYGDDGSPAPVTRPPTRLEVVGGQGPTSTKSLRCPKDGSPIRARASCVA